MTILAELHACAPFEEKDREKEKVGGRPAQLKENLEGEINNKGDVFFVGRTTWQFCSGGEKIRNASRHQCKVKMSGSQNKSEQKQVRYFLHKTCN